MKKLATVFLSTSLLAAGGSSALYAENRAAMSPVKEAHVYDFEKINETLKMALDQYIVTQNNITEIGYKYDPAKTDISKDKFHIDINLSLSKAAWTNEMVKTMAAIDFKLLGPNSDRDFKVGVVASIETDTLAMIKHHAARMAAKCKVGDHIQGIKRIFAKSHCEFAKEVASFSSLPSLYDGLTRHRNAHLSELKTYQNSLKESLLTAAPGTVRELLESQKQVSAEVERFYKNVTFAPGETSGFTITAGALDIPGVKALHGMTVTITETLMTVEAGFSTFYGRSLYQAGKPVLETVLQGLETQDEAAIKLVKLDTEFWLNLLAMRGDKPESEDSDLMRLLF